MDYGCALGALALEPSGFFNKYKFNVDVNPPSLFVIPAKAGIQGFR